MTPTTSEREAVIAEMREEAAVQIKTVWIDRATFDRWIAALTREQREGVVERALEYLRPHLEAGTFAAPDWAIQLASILTGGDGCGEPIKPQPEAPGSVAFSFAGPDGKNSIHDTWFPMKDLPAWQKWVTLREGHHVIYAYPTPPAPVDVRGLAAKWKRQAEGNYNDRANALSRCAEELLALLDGQPAGVFKSCSCVTERQRELCPHKRECIVCTAALGGGGGGE